MSATTQGGVSSVSEHAVSHAPSITGIIDWPPANLKPWSGNPRTHSDKQKAKLKASIRKFGFTSVVVVDENGTVLSGHCRVEVAKELELTTIPTRVISGLKESQKAAFVIADNKLGLLSGWDNPSLKKAIEEILIEDELEIETTGFSTAEIDLMFDGPGEPEGTDPDDLEAGDIPKEVISRVGDCWHLGHHRLLCGDALDPASYEAVMRGDLAQLVVSDVPYNVKINGHVSGKGKVKHAEFPMASGEMSQKEFTNFLHAAFLHTHAFSQDGAIHFYFIDWRHIRELQDAAQLLFGAPRQMCVWVKENGGMGTFYRSRHELVFAFKKGEVPHINNFELGQHGRYRTNVWEYPGANSFQGGGHELLASHPTVKPVSLIADALRDCSNRKGIVLDPFAGSGTILIAAERTGRYARAIELDPQYIDVAILRWQRVTDKQAVLAATGQTWNQVRTERLTKTGEESSHGL
jgi:DNA modification methylase